VHGSRNTTIIHVTQNITNYNVVQGHVVNRSFRVDQLERAVRHAVPRVRPVDLGSAQAVRQARASRDEVPVFRPRVHEASSLTPPRRKALARRAGGSPSADLREQASRQAEPRPQQRQAEPSVRRELDKHREEATRREVEARQQLERRQPSERERQPAAAQRALVREEPRTQPAPTRELKDAVSKSREKDKRKEK
jgi:hypothetical protein